MLLAALVLAAWALPVRAQLLSPGKLIDGHSKLEGLTSCTNCHELGTKGISNAKCLDCHKTIARNIDQERGLHAQNADQNCADCHKDHFGRDFDSVHFDSTGFDHRKTGFTLVGKHDGVACKSCHKAKFITDADLIQQKKEAGASLEETWLGLSQKCESCHRGDSPHGKQFADQGCQSCHQATGWKDLDAFDHNDTRFALVGKHLDVECQSCHKPLDPAAVEPVIQYTNMQFNECSSCHEDVHKGKLGPTCKNCHSPAGWHELASLTEQTFDHRSTGFPLLGKHAGVACATCHNPQRRTKGIDMHFDPATLGQTYPKPLDKNCMSCHEDYHGGDFNNIASGPDCAGCHTEKGWTPTTFGLERHNKEAGFELKASHQAIPCFSCHRDPHAANGLKFRFADTKCEGCHSADNPHGDEFARADGRTECADCHTAFAWPDSVRFDHNKTHFKLTGRHNVISCESCHKKGKDRRFDVVSTECESCHADDSPHQGQFADAAGKTECGDCHDTQSFRIASFDHSQTRFPLDGSHRNVSCASCHRTETADDGSKFVRFKPLSTKCESCHGDT